MPAETDQALTIDSAHEFRLYLRGYDDGATGTLRALAELVRAEIDGDALKSVIMSMAATRTGPGVR